MSAPPFFDFTPPPLTPPSQWGGLDLNSSSSGCARLGSGGVPPLGVVEKEVAVLIEEEVGDDLVWHPNVLLGEVATVERLGVRGEQALACPRGAASIPAVWDLGPAAPRRDGFHERVVF